MSAERGRVELERVFKRYGAQVAVDGVSFVVEPGKLVTLLGPSGCGKTTTLRMIAGLEMATEGRISIGGRDVTHASATERDVTMVFQSYALFPHMTVRENVAYGLISSGRTKAEASAKAEEGLELVGLGAFGDRLPSALSGGQQQRVAVARALVLEPAVLLLDEPLSNLDARLRRRMREEIRDLQQSARVTAVYVTHDQEEALSVSDEIIVMEKGRIAQKGTPRELYDLPASPFIAEFMGEANLIQGTLERIDARRGRMRIGGATMAVVHRDLEDGPARAAVRPEAVRLVPAGREGETEGLLGTVKKATYLGDHMEYRVETAAGEIFAVARDVDAPLAAGASVVVSFVPGRVVVLR